ncbi:hypothetical protein CMV_006502 [Castanea mollissima]|uniref:Uncharacterized protein n=1 Tax=Castanea mollissima TaxID=60419 RepID=A0A8J4VR60_9ROSI|nr:hypothetical protein CMV_006502 [Castanea mollissima]
MGREDEEGKTKKKEKKNLSLNAVAFVRNQLRQHEDVQLVNCEALPQAVLDQQSEDNVSIVITDLGQTDWKSLPLQNI